MVEINQSEPKQLPELTPPQELAPAELETVSGGGNVGRPVPTTLPEPPCC